MSAAAPGRGLGGGALLRAAALLVLAWLAHRALWIASLPAVPGTDTYTRLYHHEQLLVPLFGRNWLPLLQSAIHAVYALGGAADQVVLLMALLGTALLLAGAYTLLRIAGPGAALVFALLASVNEDLLWVSSAPYQEAPLYLLACGVLLRVRRLGAGERGSPGACLLGSLPWLLLALLCRFEGLLLSAATGLAIAVHAWRDRHERRPAFYAGIALGLAVLPALFLHWIVGFGVEGGEAPAPLPYATRVGISATALLRHLAKPEMLLWTALAIGGFLARPLRPRAWPPEALLVLAYTAGFLALYLFANPFVPPQNSRFHVPLNLVLIGAAAWAAPRLVAAAPAALRRRLVALAGVLLLLHAYGLWTSTSEITVRRLANRTADAATGRRLDALLAADARLLVAWPRGSYFGHPGHVNMRIVSYLRGSAGRVLFADELEALPAAERAAWLRGAAGVLVPTARLDSAPLRALLREVASVQGAGGGAWWWTELTKQRGLVSFGPRPDPSSRAFPLEGAAGSGS